MYILEITNHYPNKKYPLNGIFARDQAIALANEGCEIIVAALDLRSIRRPRPFGFSKKKVDGVTVYTLSLYMGNVPSFIFNSFSRFAFKLLYNKIVEENGKPKLIHAHFLEMAQACIDVIKKENIPFFITEHTSTLNNEEISKNHFNLMNETYPLAKQIIAVSESLQKSIKKHTGIDSSVVYNIVDISTFKYQEHKIKDDSFHFVSCGALDKRKDFETLLKAFAQHLKKYPQDKLTIFGDGKEKNNLKRLSDQLNINDRVTFALRASREEIAKTYKDAQIFILLSKLETFGVVYIEAMSTGLPVIATRCGGPENFVTDETGFIIEPENIEQAISAMEYIRLNYDKYDQKEISKYTNNLFSPKTIAQQIIKIFNSNIE
ncbi:MAG: glycosyltransferase [Clostridia bacterium]|nr:glycosyltransferase [Clostridia bacterium]